MSTAKNTNSTRKKTSAAAVPSGTVKGKGKTSAAKNQRVLAKDIFVSNDTKETGLNNNDLIIGSSGTGKTGGYVIPNLQNITGSMVVSDTKGQLRKMFSGKLRSKGYDVYTLDFVNPQDSCGFNPLKSIRRYPSGKYREQDILTLANNIVPTLHAEDPYWDKAAKGYIAFLISFCLDVMPPEDQNMIMVCDLHSMILNPNGYAPFEEWAEANPDSFSARKYAQIKSITRSSKTWACILDCANRALDPFIFEEAKGIFKNPNSFDIPSLGKKKTVLFLNVSDTDSTFDPLVNIFHTQALQMLCSEADANPNGRLKVPVRIIMDDFAASAKIPDFNRIISVIRSRDISVSIILQSMTQLESMYSSAEADTIVSNCHHVLYLGSQDFKTAAFVGSRAFKSPDSVMCIPQDSAILITNFERGKIVEKIRPYSTMESPEVPESTESHESTDGT